MSFKFLRINDNRFIRKDFFLRFESSSISDKSRVSEWQLVEGTD